MPLSILFLPELLDMPVQGDASSGSVQTTKLQRVTKIASEGGAKGASTTMRDKRTTTSSTSSVSQRRQNDISDLQRRLSYLTNAIDDTLQRTGSAQAPTVHPTSERHSVAPLRTLASPAPTRPSVVTSRASSVAAAAANDADGSTQPPPPLPDAVDKQAVPTTKLFSLVSKTASAPPRNGPSTTTTTPSLRLLPPPVVSPPRERAADAVTRRSPRQGLMSPTHEKSRNQERAVGVVAAGPLHLGDPSSSSIERLRVEEADLKLRIAALKRIEEEKTDLIAHQKRLLDLDRERQRLDDERRRSIPRSGSGRSPSATSSGTGAPQLAHTTAMVDVAPPLPHRHHVEEEASPAIHLSERRSSPSPIQMLSAATPSHDRVAMDDALRSMMRGGPPTPRRLRNDKRYVCRDILIDHGIEGRVLTGRHASVGCRLHLSPDAKELLAFPHARGNDGVQESHHFPLHKGTLLYPNGVVQHHWLPQRVHVSGIVVGNRARSVLLAKGYPHFIDVAPENRLRLYLIVGGDAYSEASTLLVLEMASRREWLCLVLGLHGAMWPDGKPPLTAGRALWLMTCHAVMQLHWDANGTRDTLLHQSRRRSRSAEPSSHMRGVTAATHPALPPDPAAAFTATTPTLATSRFALPASPPRFAVPSLSGAAPTPQPLALWNRCAPQNNSGERWDPSVAASSSGFPPTPAQPQMAARTMQEANGTNQPNVPRAAVVPQPMHNRSTAVAGRLGASGAAMPASKTFFPKTSNRPSSRSAILQYGY